MYIDLVGTVFANGPGDLGSIPGRVIPKTLKMVIDTSLLNTQQYKVHIKDKVEQSWERSIPPLYLGVVAIEKGAFWLPSTMVANFTYYAHKDFKVTDGILESMTVGSKPEWVTFG